MNEHLLELAVGLPALLIVLGVGRPSGRPARGATLLEAAVLVQARPETAAQALRRAELRQLGSR